MKINKSSSFILTMSLIFFVNMNSYAVPKIVVIPLGGDPVKMGEPIADACSVFLSDSDGSESCSFSIVPDGKVFVIEFISGRVTLPQGQAPYAQMRLLTINSSSTTDMVSLRYQAPYSANKSLYITNQPVKIYIDEKHTPTIRVNRVTKTGTANGTFILNGYLVDKK